MAIFENRNAVYSKVHEYRKLRKLPFAASHGGFPKIFLGGFHKGGVFLLESPSGGGQNQGGRNS